MTAPFSSLTDTSTPVPSDIQWRTVRRIWHVARLLFAGVIVGGVVAVALLSAGMADPPRVGPLAWDNSSSISVDLAPHYTIAQVGNPVALPPIYTLEISATLSGDPSASWRVNFLDSAERVLFAVTVDGQQFYTVPPFAPDSIPFIHLRSDSNTLSWTTEANGRAILHINEEIAWHGFAPSAVTAQISAVGGRTQLAHLVINQIALYAPH